MNVYSCTAFTGHWPVPTAAVVVANTKEEAATMLEGVLAMGGLTQSVEPESMKIVDPSAPHVELLSDGQY